MRSFQFALPFVFVLAVDSAIAQQATIGVHTVLAQHDTKALASLQEVHNAAGKTQLLCASFPALKMTLETEILGIGGRI
jgi:hypothetical protein